MAGTFNIIWSRLMHDLTLYNQPVTTVDLMEHLYHQGPETPEGEAERLHTEVAGAVESGSYDVL